MADTVDWIRWTMRTGPLVDALIEHLVGDLVRYALENSFHVVVEALFWHELTHGRAAGCSWVTGGAARPGHQGRGAGPLAPGTTVVLRRPRASLPTGQPDDRPGRPGTPREG
ncbi:hypothetical protein [Streptomyces sp. NPDC051636]|uniref:hypothetical protein n=1 Tax=Streptomyces sp. NPDC051636 TaxID=3365663 RepID=UPI003793E320